MIFKPFKFNMLDEIYESGSKNIFVKTRRGDIVSCSLNWDQGGYGDNYHFISNNFGFEIRLDIISEVAYEV